VVIVELLNLNLPVDTQLRAVLDGDRKVTTVVETPELAGRNWSSVKGSCLGLLRCGLLLRLEKAERATANTFTFLDGS
jgi:hypothetical protein